MGGQELTKDESNLVSTQMTVSIFRGEEMRIGLLE